MHTKAAAILFFFIGFLLSITTVSGQDAAFSQFYANPVYLNPAFAGNRICPRISLSYRNQYPALGSHFVTYSAGFDTYVSSLSGGVAVLTTADMTGPLASYSGSAVYSYHLKINEKFSMNAALQAGYYQYRLNWDQLIFEDMIETGTGEIISGNEIQPPKLHVGDVDFSTGMVVGYDEKYYLGAAVHHITSPDLAFYQGNISRLDARLTIHAGAVFDLKQAQPGSENDNLSISPNVVYMQQGDFHQLNGGMYLNFYPFVAGLWMRHNFENPDALIAMLGFQQKEFKVGYSFDFTLSKLGLPAGGAHEISFVWFLPCPKKEFKYKAIKCPSF
ncbi:MAG: type IX secretion system membrane protein PorP/SprF [Lentimicrobiaceae bacterium]|jgi:type IX secretion system PorP/SprF family membrane protein